VSCALTAERRAEAVRKRLLFIPRLWVTFTTLVAALLAVSTASLGQDPVRVIDTPNMSIGEEPLRAFKTVEKAWRSGNAQALADLLSGSRVYVEIRGIEDMSGYFTRPQILYIFKDMFASMKQLNFSFVRYYSREKEGSRVYGIAQRSYKNNRGNKLYRDTVYFTLVKEESRWAVVEIKSTW
jgi:hypothetical protein